MLLETDHTGGLLGSGVSFVDFNLDGFDDLSFAHHEGNLRFYIGNGDEFLDVSLGIDNGNDEAKGIAWVDYDNDSDLDLFITNRLAPNRVWRNDNTEFVDVSSSIGINQSESTRSYGMSFSDFNNDGLIDFYICNYHTWIDNASNELYQNNGDGTFSEITEAAGVGNGFQQSFQATWIDINEDGWMDLHVINDRLDMKNAFYINNSDGTFTDLAPVLGVDIGVSAMSSSFGDFDRDGDMDLYVTNGYSGNYLFMNQTSQSGSFIDVTLNYGVGLYELCWAADWIDYDNDIYPDLFVSTGISVYTDFPNVLDELPALVNELYFNTQAAPFPSASYDIPSTPSHTFSIAQGDFNNDGFPDLISHKIGNYATLLSGTSNNNNWVKVNLEGTSSNRFGIGCEIRVNHVNSEGDVSESFDVVIAGENYLGQNSYSQHFGLSNSQSIEFIEVTWTGGATEVYGPFSVNQELTLVEGESNSIEGCTYLSSCNYDPESNIDDGSCDFSCLCGEGAVWDISSEKCVGYIECPTDINQSGSTEVGDLLMILAEYGAICSD
jgi:hypothetical protein